MQSIKTEYFKRYSKSLKKDMEFKRYGTGGKIMLFFPTQAGRFFQYEDFKMIETLKSYITEEKIQIFCVDSIDTETYEATNKPFLYRVKKQEEYFHYIIDEVVPLFSEICSLNKPLDNLLSAGCSMGAFHAANFFFRRPDIFDTLIALSGLYSSKSFWGDYEEDIKENYLNSPYDYLKNISDDYYLELYRKANIIICTGQGAWEDLMIEETLLIKEELKRKRIPAWIDFWGKEVEHDWHWWKLQMVYFLNHILYDEDNKIRKVNSL